MKLIYTLRSALDRLWIGPLVCILMVGLAVGDGAAGQTSSGQGGPAPASGAWTPAIAHTLIRMHNPQYNGQGQFRIQNGKITAAALSGTNITDLTPLSRMDLMGLDLRGLKIENIQALEGVPLIELYIEDTAVSDLAPLKGMQLARLYLSNTPVKDLSPLKDMPIESLNLLGTPITDLTPLAKMPLQFLWLNETPVADIVPLSSCPLVSLTLHKTRVKDLAPLANTRLERLHIGDTPVKDLSPLKEVPLKRLVFTPSRITGGIEMIRAKESLREIGPSFEERFPPSHFWKLFDEGAFDPK